MDNLTMSKKPKPMSRVHTQGWVMLVWSGLLLHPPLIIEELGTPLT